jgi:3-hydroxymyristoyl/3-hydroxydecanoyl-(acyl carrier protein) dehydratase
LSRDLFPNSDIELIPLEPDRPGTWCFRINTQSRCFYGHFEGFPIFPGVAHLALVLMACHLRDTKPSFLTEVRELRLRKPVFPDDEIAVTISGEPNSELVRFELRRAGELVSGGVVAIQGRTADA